MGYQQHGHPGGPNQVKELANLFITGGVPNPQWAAQLHEEGLLIYNYANPQCGIEEPLTYRRNCGLLLWKTGYDGVMNYAYQATFGEHMWNDFDRAGDSRGYRDHVMAYATSNGVVDTLQQDFLAMLARYWRRSQFRI